LDLFHLSVSLFFSLSLSLFLSHCSFAMQQKRPAETLDDAALMGGPEAKCPRLGTTVPGAPKPVEVTVRLASGSTLATVIVPETYTGADVKSSLRSFVQNGTEIQQLCFGAQLFRDDQTVQNLNSSTQVALQALLVEAQPCAHLFQPCSAMELSIRHDGWTCGCELEDEWEGPDGEGNFCLPAVEHRKMDGAPALARDIAVEIKKQFDNEPIRLVVVGDNYPKTDEVIVISHPGDDPKRAVLQALGIRRENLLVDEDGEEAGGDCEPGSGFNMWDDAQITDMDWSTGLIGMGLSRDDDSDDGYDDHDNDEDESVKKTMAITNVMAKTLTRHFQFEMNTDRHECWKTPVFWGGFASDGSIVGVLGTYLNC